MRRLAKAVLGQRCGALLVAALVTGVLVGVTSSSLAPAPAQATVVPLGASSTRQVSTGSRFSSRSCAITAVGGVSCWGAELNVNTPTQVPGLTSGATTVTSGDDFDCAIVSGAARCWGANAKGQLGQGTTGSTQTSPVTPIGLGSDVVAIDAGWTSACAVRSDGTVWCWGSVVSAVSSGTVTTTPAQVPGLTGITSIAVDEGMACAGSPLGAWCWGASGWGGVSSATPVKVDGVGAVRSIGNSSGMACALTLDGTVWCWGQLTFLGPPYGNKPPTIAVTGARFLAVGGNLGLACATKADGTTWCWGDSGMYRIQGDGLGLDDGGRAGVHQLQSFGEEITSMDVSESHACAAGVSGTVRCWGDPDRLVAPGALGTGAARVLTPTVPPALTTGVADVATGTEHTCVLSTAGGVSCFGSAAWNRLGTSLVGRLPSAPIAGLTSGVVDIAVGDRASCAVTTGGAVTCWGTGLSGLPANGTSTPTTITGLSSGISAVAISTSFGCALTTAGGVKCWGSNSDGQLGNGTTTSSATPVDVTGLTSGVASITVGFGHACARRTTGTVACWGSNGSGRLGNGTTTSSSTPVNVSSLTGALDVSAGVSHTCATTATTVRCWGSGANGRLGNNALTSSSVPVAVTANISVAGGHAQVSAHGNGTCVRSTAGALRCWGANTFGEVGNGTTTDAKVPVVIATSGFARLVEGGGPGGFRLYSPEAYTRCAVTTAGALACWGYNDSSQTGTTGGIAPIPVLGGPIYSTATTPNVVLATATDQTVDANRSGPTAITLSATYAGTGSLDYAVVTAPTKGEVSCTLAGACTYTPTPGAAGSDSFTFSVADPDGGIDSGTVTINLINVAPTASDGALTVTRSTAKRLGLGGSDADGGPLSYEIVDQPAAGTLSCTGQDCTYTAPATAGPQAFTFRTIDDQGATSPPATWTIDVVPPRVSVGSAQVLEPDGAIAGVYVPITLTAPTTGDVTISYYTIDATATGGVTTGDYRTWGTPSAPRTIKIAAGQTWNAIAVPIFADATTEPDETFTVHIASVTAADGSPVAIRDADATVTIVDNYRASSDPLIIVQNTETAEGDSTTINARAQLIVQLTKPLAVPLTISYRTIAGTATAGPHTGTNDYRDTTGTVTLPAGSLGKTFDIAIWGDTDAETDELFVLQATLPDGAPVIQLDVNAIATIVNDD